MAKIPIEEATPLPEEGSYTGKVTKTEISTRPYKGGEVNYLDVKVSVDGVEMGDKPLILSAGYPLPAKVGGLCALMFSRFGLKAGAGEQSDSDELVGKKVKFLLEHEKGKSEGQMFAKLLRSSLKPIKA